jgi:hypothetical protein
MFYHIFIIILAVIDILIAYRIIQDINQLKQCNCFIENVNLKMYNPSVILYREVLFIVNFIFILFSSLYVLYLKNIKKEEHHHYNRFHHIIYSKYSNMKENYYWNILIIVIKYAYILFTVLSILGYLSFTYDLQQYDKNDCECTKELKYLLILQVFIITFLFLLIIYV